MSRRLDETDGKGEAEPAAVAADPAGANVPETPQGKENEEDGKGAQDEKKIDLSENAPGEEEKGGFGQALTCDVATTCDDCLKAHNAVLADESSDKGCFWVDDRCTDLEKKASPKVDETSCFYDPVHKMSLFDNVQGPTGFGGTPVDEVESSKFDIAEDSHTSHLMGGALIVAFVGGLFMLRKKILAMGGSKGRNEGMGSDVLSGLGLQNGSSYHGSSSSNGGGGGGSLLSMGFGMNGRNSMANKYASETVPLANAMDDVNDEEWGWEEEGGGGSSSSSPNIELGRASAYMGSSAMSNKKRDNEVEDDDELQRAIELSLADGPSATTSPRPSQTRVIKRTGSNNSGPKQKSASELLGSMPMPMPITSFGAKTQNKPKPKPKVVKSNHDDLFESLGLSAKPTFTPAASAKKAAPPVVPPAPVSAPSVPVTRQTNYQSNNNEISSSSISNNNENNAETKRIARDLIDEDDGLGDDWGDDDDLDDLLNG